MDDLAPPLKRRRTSQDGSQASSRPQSQHDNLAFRPPSRRDSRHEEDIARRRTTRSRSMENGINGDRYHNEDRRQSYIRRSRSGSSSYSPRPRDSVSRSPPRRPSSRSLSRSYSPEPHTEPAQSRLSFSTLAHLPRVHSRGITCLKFSPDLSLLAVASADSTISIYTVAPSSPNPLRRLRILRAHLAGVNAIAWSPIGPNYTLASASDDKSILLWTPLSSDFPISPSPLVGHSNYVYSLAFSPKGNMLVTGSYDEAVFLWDVRSATVMRTLPAHSDPVSGVDFLRDGSMVCSCASDGLIRIWDSGTGQCLKTLVDEDRKSVTSVRFTPNGDFVCAWTLDGCIRLWKYTEGKCVKTYEGHINEEYSLNGTIGSFGPERNEAFVASGSEDGDLLVWDVSSKEILWRARAHDDVVLSVDFGRMRDLDGEPNGRGLLVSAGKDRDLKLWIIDGEDHLDVEKLDGTLPDTEEDVMNDQRMDLGPDTTVEMTVKVEATTTPLHSARA